MWLTPTNQDGKESENVCASPAPLPATHVPTVPEVLAVYEKEMLARSAVKVRHSAEAAIVLHKAEALSKTHGQTRAAAAKAMLAGKDPMNLRHS